MRREIGEERGAGRGGEGSLLGRGRGRVRGLGVGLGLGVVLGALLAHHAAEPAEVEVGLARLDERTKRPPTIALLRNMMKATPTAPAWAPLLGLCFTALSLRSDGTAVAQAACSPCARRECSREAATGERRLRISESAMMRSFWARVETV